MTQPVAGWYPDPSGDASKIRWWDGSKWTENTRDNIPAGTPMQSNAGYQPAPNSIPSSAAIPTATPASIAPVYQQTNGYQATSTPTQYGQITTPVKDNHQFATAGFICAISGLAVCILSVMLFYWIEIPFFIGVFLLSFAASVPSIILGALGLKSTKRGLAVTALVLGILGIVAFILFMILVFTLLSNFNYFF